MTVWTDACTAAMEVGGQALCVPLHKYTISVDQRGMLKCLSQHHTQQPHNDAERTTGIEMKMKMKTLRGSTACSHPGQGGRNAQQRAGNHTNIKQEWSNENQNTEARNAQRNWRRGKSAMFLNVVSTSFDSAD